MNAQIIHISTQDLIVKLDEAMSMWRAQSQGGEHDWYLSQSGHCDDFALALGQCLHEIGLSHSFNIISRETKNSRGQLHDRNHFCHAFVSVHHNGAEIQIDSMGTDADNNYVNDWQNERGLHSEFDYKSFGSGHVMAEFLRTPIQGYGRPRSSPERADLIEVWTNTLRESLSKFGLEPVNRQAGAPSVRIYYEVSWQQGDPLQWYSVDIPTVTHFLPSPEIGEGTIKCLYERVIQAARVSLGHVSGDPDSFRAYLSDGRELVSAYMDQIKNWDHIGQASSVTPMAQSCLPARVQLICAIQDKKPVDQSLLEQADAARLGEWGSSMLFEAVGCDNVPLCERLLQAGADPNEMTGHGRTPLEIAAYADTMGPLRALVNAGADINRVNAHGQTPATQALHAINGRDKAFWLVAKGGAIEQEGGIVINTQVDDLLELYESHNVIAKKDLTPKVAAVMGNHVTELLQLLQDHPQAKTPLEEIDQLRALAKFSGHDEAMAAIDAHRSSSLLKNLAAQGKKAHP